MISILIPTLNEADNIDFLAERVRAALEGAGLDFEMVFADGGSKDGTQDRVKAMAGAGHGIRLVESDGAKGLAGDILNGAKECLGDIVVVMDADLSHPPESLPALVQPLIAGTHDMVIGSRYVPGGSTPGWPLKRRLASRAAALLAWPLTEVRDPLAGFFAVRREMLLAVESGAEGFKIGLEVLMQGGDDLRVAEVPISFVDRRAGESKMNSKQVFSYLRRLATLSGGSVSRVTAVRFGFVGLLGVGVDFLIFQTLVLSGAALGPSHISSFAVAALFNYILNAAWAFRHPGEGARRLGWRGYARFVAVAVMALAIRGAVLALAAAELGLPVQAGIILAIGAAAVVNYLGTAFYVFPSPTVKDRADMRWRVAAVGVVAYIVLLRLLYMGQIDLTPQEAYYWNYEQHLDIGYLDHPPMVAWLIWVWTEVLGDNEFAIRMGALVCWLAAAGFAYRLTMDLYGKAAALRAVLLMAVLPFFFGTGLMMTPDAPLVACWAGAIYYFQRALRLESRGAWLGVGVCMGLGMLSKYTIALLGPAALAFILADKRSRRWLVRPEPWAGAILALAVFSPVIIWNIQHGWASFAFQSADRLAEPPEFSLHVLVGWAALLLTPVGLAAAIGALVRPQGVGEDDRRRLFALTFTLVPLAVFAFFSLRHEVKMNWTGPLWLAVLPAVAWAIAPRGLGRAAPRGWPATVMASLLIYGLFLHYLVLGLPGLGHRDKMRLPIGWEELGAQVSVMADDLGRTTGLRPVVIGMDKYFITSQLAFYGRSAPMSPGGAHLLGKKGLMYERWNPAAGFDGRPAIMVGFSPRELEDPALADRFESLGPVERLEVVREKQVVGVCYVRVGYGYRPAR